MNVVTSICTMVTVLLVAYGIFLQKEEFKAIKDHAEKQGSINRAVKLMEEWQDASIKDVEAEEFDISGLSIKERRFIDRLLILESINGDEVVNFDLLTRFIKSDGVDDRLKKEKESFSNILNSLKRRRCDLIADKEMEPDSDSEETIESDFYWLDRFNKSQEANQRVKDVDSEIKEYEYKILEIEKILGFLKC